MKKRSDATQYRAPVVVRRSLKISPRRRPFPGGEIRPKFNQLEMVTTFNYTPDLVKIDALIVVTDPQTNNHTNMQTDRGDYNTLRCSLARSVLSVTK